MNAYHLLIMPININIDCTNIIKTELQNRVLRSNPMQFQRIFGKFSLIIGVSNDTKKEKDRENDFRYIEILILVLKNRKYNFSTTIALCTGMKSKEN